MTNARKLTLSLPAGFVHWHVHMRYPRYEWPIKIPLSTLTSAGEGVTRRVWGYPTLDPNENVEAYNRSEIYEGQVSFSIILSRLIVIRPDTLYHSYWKPSNSYRFLP